MPPNTSAIRSRLGEARSDGCGGHVSRVRRPKGISFYPDSAHTPRIAFCYNSAVDADSEACRYLVVACCSLLMSSHSALGQENERDGLPPLDTA
jgi:hypothetical protein